MVLEDGKVMSNRLLSTLMSMAAYAVISAETILAGGNLSYSGSSTIGMGIFEAGASRHFEEATGISLASLEMPGSGKGVQALIGRKVSVAGVSWTLNKNEMNLGLVGTVIGHDAIAIFVHNNNPVKNLSKEQL